MESSQSHREKEHQAIRFLRTLSLEDCRQIVPWFTFPDWLSLAHRLNTGKFDLDNADKVVAKLQKLLVKAGYCEDSYFWARLQELQSQAAQTAETEHNDEVIEESTEPDPHTIEEASPTSTPGPVTSDDSSQSTSIPEPATPDDMPQQTFHTDPVSLFVQCLRTSSSPTTDNIENLKRSLDS